MQTTDARLNEDEMDGERFCLILTPAASNNHLRQEDRCSARLIYLFICVSLLDSRGIQDLSVAVDFLPPSLHGRTDPQRGVHKHLMGFSAARRKAGVWCLGGLNWFPLTQLMLVLRYHLNALQSSYRGSCSVIKRM